MLASQFDIKSADELVASTRLNVIEKEHKSFGSLIDHRQLFSLDETSKPLKKKCAPTDDSAALSNFLRATTLEHGLTTPRKFSDAIDTTAIIVSNQCYANEELMWRTKASVPAYYQKRVYEDPTLQSFRDSLTLEQKRRNKELTLQALHTIADKYRAEMSKIKEEMDTDGVFHPAANAHRVHCMYLMKIYKGISAHTIEDPVLKRLRAESIEKSQADAADEERKQLLIRIATVGGEEVARETAERRASIIAIPIVRDTVTPLQSSAGSQLARKASMASLGAVPPPLTRRPSCSALTLDQLLFSSAAVTGGASSSETTTGGQDKEREKNFPVSRASKARKRVPSAGAESATAVPNYISKKRGSDSSQSSSVGVRTGTGTGMNPFLGGERTSTPLQTLRERDAGDDDNDDPYTGGAADKILKANYEPQDSNVPGNMGNIPHVDKMMFNRMKQRRLGAVDARSLLPDEANRLEKAFVSNPKKEKQRSALINNENTVWILEKLQLNAASRPPLERGMDPPPVVPFEVFQKMFEEYTSSSSAPPGEAGRTRAGPGSDGHESRDSHSYTSLEAPTLNGNRTDGGADGADLDTAMNAVQHLAKEDRLFDSFLKMSLREKPVGRQLTRASAVNLMAPKVKRVSAPLGLSAVLLEPLTQPRTHSSNQDTFNSTSQTSCLTASSTNPTLRPDYGKSKSANYMCSTRQVLEKDRHNKMRKASGFTNCFQAADVTDLGCSGGTFLSGAHHTQTMDCNLDTMQSGTRGKGIPAPVSDTEGQALKVTRPESHAIGSMRSAAMRRREREREEEEGTTPRGDSDRSTKSKGDDLHACAIQGKLLQMWECLEVPAAERIDFMRKYSMYPFSMKLDIATDLWSEVAVLVMARQEIMKILVNLKGGYRRMPLHASDLVDAIAATVPPDLASSSSVYVPLGAPSTPGKAKALKQREGEEKKSKKVPPVPLSSAMLSSMVEHINQRFRVVATSEAILRCSVQGPDSWQRGRAKKQPVESFARSLASSLMMPGNPSSRRDGEETRRKKSPLLSTREEEEDRGKERDKELQISAETEASACLLQLRKMADQLLLASLRKVLDEVSDVVTYGKIPVQEWMNAAVPEQPIAIATMDSTLLLSSQQSFASGHSLDAACS